ncbi:uncharacterized protein LOC126553744 [Aphis gossypii]|uniref:uncharacterized protein LOC126553744 n=1 Tax=Aphis gossypii TaxID=80765 RepID=UPI002158C095|nr:uncharacterized protein LOC126553744 [Aphis gossypii]
MFKNRSDSIHSKIYFLPNRLHVNLKEAIKILKKPFITESIECTQLEPQSDGIKWEATGTTLLPNKENPMLIAKYFSSKNIYKSVFKLIKNNKYDASLVNYTNDISLLDLPKDKIQKAKSLVSRKMSIKSIMKRRFEKMNEKKNSTQNSENSENNNCDLPSTSTSTPAVQFMEVDSENSYDTPVPIEENSNFNKYNDADISDIQFHQLETTIESISR